MKEKGWADKAMKTKQHTTDMTSGNSRRQLIAFTIPLILGNIFQLAYNFTDTLVVGRFAGSVALAAVGTSDPIMNLLILGVSGICVGASVLMSQFFGAGEHDRLAEELHTVVIMGLLFSFAVLLAGVFFTEQILTVLNVPDDLLEDASAYLRIILISMPFTCLYNIYAASLRAIGDSKTPIYFLVLSSLCNIGLDILLVAGFHMGVVGAGLATAIAEALSAVLCIIYTNRTVSILRFRWRSFRPNAFLVKKTLSYGGLTAIQQCSQPIGNLMIQSTVNTLGVASIAAFNAARKIEDIGLVPGRSIGNSNTTFVAQNIGAGNTQRAEKGHTQAIQMEIVTGILISGIVLALRSPLMRIFTADAEIISEGIRYFAIIGFFYWLPCINNGNQGYFRGVGRMKTVLLGTLTQISLRVIFTILLIPRYGIEGIGIACVIGWTVQCIWQTIYHRMIIGKSVKAAK